MLDAAFAAARMGVWECSLPDEVLTWTDGVFDLFDIPRGTTPDRALILDCYEPDTRLRLTDLRAEAIRTLSGFELDARVVTALGTRRWIRITASVEARDGVAFRIFGVKRDITTERDLLERTLYLATHDELTGLKNRTAFNRAMEDAAFAGGATLMLLDLDGFKGVNDRFGHSAGDDVLRAVATRLASVSPGGSVVARLGGDEFAVVSDRPSAEVERLATTIVEIVGDPIVVEAREFLVGVSIGIATARKGEHPTDLYRRADAALYRAKHDGRNTHRVCEAG
ncbi:sensor domain-containing diguanylate cyclase [uncultured Aureimonas sp.]|uniref:sensor domain-containing diguanylate cyclase n=1 Tax=uncultured Aureimonas sp. TaxID=1604662 RepID=UPI0025F1241C|nr:sensor domain-containing diguanylate cyclase [uncultured Aureimonas sp.]